jgi:hypothetical protein
MRRPVDVTFTWSEAANLLVAANHADTAGWTPAARGNLNRAIDKLAAAVPMDDPNAFFLVVRGQTPLPPSRPPALASDQLQANIPVLVRLSGRCADGAERDGGRRIHVVLTANPLGHAPAWAKALCGAKPGRRSALGFVEVDGAENPTCPRCARLAEKLAGRS